MKFSEQWLREWVNPKITTEALAARLTMAGLEVDTIERVASPLEGIVVGRVQSLEAHPDADKLRVCRVDVGAKDPLVIVCGAKNVEKGGRYPVALIGAQLPGGLTIKKAKLRGVESSGMLCSGKELQLEESADGLLTLPSDAPIGESFSDYLQLDDHCIELGLTPNRGDCLSIAGIAREVSVLSKEPYNGPAQIDVKPVIKDVIPVNIPAHQHCPRYVGRIIRNVNPVADTPIWMKEKLRRCGLRSLGPIVDVTNYVLLEFGQPMHAFDLEKIKTGIQVRLSTANEKLVLLDGHTIELAANDLVIADDKNALALAGIMGGADSAVSNTTTHIFLESAYFDPTRLAGRARFYGLRTDSSHRFERGVDPALQAKAMQRATQLLLEIVGGEPGPIIDCVADKMALQKSSINLRYSRIGKILGVEISRERINDILLGLEMQLTGTKEGWQVVPPSFRFDISIEVDLIEEVARIIGYDAITSQAPVSTSQMFGEPEGRIPMRRFREVLVERGYQEAITYSFVDPKLQQIIMPDTKSIAVTNPISADMSAMRTSLWTGLLQAMRYNLNRQQETVNLFETGLRFVSVDGQLVQENMLAGVRCGGAAPRQWGESYRELDFFDIKQDVMAILTLTGEASGFTFQADLHPALHPGQTARIVLCGDSAEKTIGWVGALHPQVAQKLDISQRVFVFELLQEPLQHRQIPEFSEISKYPAITRDLAIVVEEAVTIKKLCNTIFAAAPASLTGLELFDVYTGKGVANGKKSLAFGLTLQNSDRTLTDDEVDTVIANILSIINKELGATLRE